MAEPIASQWTPSMVALCVNCGHCISAHIGHDCPESNVMPHRARIALEDLLALQMFVDSCIGEFPDIGDIDGFALQDIAESCGLLVKQTMTVPCGENCACAEVIDSDRTTECMRIQPALHRARVASAKAHAWRLAQRRRG